MTYDAIAPLIVVAAVLIVAAWSYADRPRPDADPVTHRHLRRADRELAVLLAASIVLAGVFVGLFA